MAIWKCCHMPLVPHIGTTTSVHSALYIYHYTQETGTIRALSPEGEMGDTSVWGYITWNQRWRKWIKLYYSSQGWQDELLNTIYPFASSWQLSPLSSAALTIELYISALVSPFQISASSGQPSWLDLNFCNKWRKMCINFIMSFNC